ncbi:MAG: helix-turn-helix domain-containing protein [Ruminococcaceae bacterium]|nr:helix-turn-helix domain-containing protein [Oscillospiraceae bacterium]
MELYRTNLAKELPVLRAKLRLSQEELAELLDVSRHTIISIESNKRLMQWTTFLALIYILQQFSETRKMLASVGLLPLEYNKMLSEIHTPDSDLN